MIRIILSGACGAMGQAIAKCVEQRSDCEIIAGIDPSGRAQSEFPVFPKAADLDLAADVIVDFSHPIALADLLVFAKARQLPLVVATTGLSDEQIASIHAASIHIPIFFTANMSLGVNLMRELAKTAARILGGQFDIEIIERHHNQKIDAPSGTALMLADAVSSVLDETPQYVYDRHTQRKKRSKTEIGIHAVRGGTIAGEHEILFAGRDELLSISHTATSKEVFATGAISAALFLNSKTPGLYDMTYLIEQHG